MADMLATERTLSRDIVPAVERAVPGVEVLAVELLSPSRFCVYVDHPEGVDHALCARVTEILARVIGDDQPFLRNSLALRHLLQQSIVER